MARATVQKNRKLKNIKNHDEYSNTWKYLPILVLLCLKGVHLESLVSCQVKDFKTAVGLIKDPVDKAFMAIGNMNCAGVKKLVGVDYDHEVAKEPDLSHLTLKFRSRLRTVTYALNSAAQLLVNESWFNTQHGIIIYIHGFTDDPTLGPNFGPISDAFLKTGEHNILGLDASSLIRYFYLRSTTFVRFIGMRLGEVLAAMMKKGLDPKSIHLIGHSLGSHIAGFTGKQFTELTGGKVGRISGLDPAGPCFSLVDSDLRLKATDADFVDVIHTDGGVFGMTEPIGHVDFYPNGGSSQPNCLTQTCSHLRVNGLFAESILKPKAFIARACKSWNEFKLDRCGDEDTTYMGHGCPETARGVYYLRTGDGDPFGLGDKGLRYQLPFL